MRAHLKTLTSNTLMVIVCLFTLSHKVQAENVDYAAEAERRAKLAGQSLVGMPAPHMKIETLNGEVIDLADVYGKKPVYIKFWATWCVPCREQMPRFEEIYKRYKNDIQVISVNTGINDNRASVSAFVKKVGLTMPTTIDHGSLARAFQLRVTPQHLLIDRNGEFSYFGHLDDEEFHLAIEHVIKEPTNTSQRQRNPALKLEAPGYKVGDTISSLAFTSIDNKPLEFHFGSEDSKQVGVVFFGPWCEWYLEETAPHASQMCTQVRKLLEQKSQTSNTEWVSISTNVWSSIPELHEYKKSYGTSLPIVFDQNGEIFEQFGVNQLPTITLINKNGSIQLKSSLQDEDFSKTLDIISNLQ
ncbi:redoxin family protein [Vibrio alginolyticus]|uniref:redoxin family protein n=1 Tax=Vibrio alginolyticus TaxID=663 RepID=UPI00354FC32F